MLTALRIFKSIFKAYTKVAIHVEQSPLLIFSSIKIRDFFGAVYLVLWGESEKNTCT